MGCKYHEFSRQDVFSCFHKRSDNAAIVMIGASQAACVTAYWVAIHLPSSLVLTASTLGPARHKFKFFDLG